MIYKGPLCCYTDGLHDPKTKGGLPDRETTSDARYYMLDLGRRKLAP